MLIYYFHISFLKVYNTDHRLTQYARNQSICVCFSTMTTHVSLAIFSVQILIKIINFPLMYA